MKYFILTILLIFVPLTIQAKTLSFSWTKYTDNADSFTIYQIKDGKEIIKLSNIPITDTTASFDDELIDDCNTYYIRAIKGDQVSEPSNTSAWCKDISIPEEIHLPNTINGFTISVTVSPN